MTILHTLSKRCDDIAAANGFDRPSWDNLVSKLMLVGTELDEARDAVLGTGADPLDEEFADAAIRLLSILYALWGDAWHDRITVAVQYQRATAFQSIETLLWPTLAYCFKAVENRRNVKDPSTDDVAAVETRTCVELALKEVFKLAYTLNIDLLASIDKKCTKNEGRAKLHGKATAL